MSRLSIAEWYRRVNAEWPANLPALDAETAIITARKLWRFVHGSTLDRDAVIVTSGRRYTWMRRGVMYVNPDRGWHNFVHDLSHLFHQHTSRERPHGATHARMEIRLIREVIKRGLVSIPEPTPAERVLQMLPATDIEIACELGVSYRSARGIALGLTRRGAARWAGRKLVPTTEARA